MEPENEALGANLRGPRNHMRSEMRVDMRLYRAYSRAELTDWSEFKHERVDFWPVKADFTIEWADFRPGRANFGTDRAYLGRGA